MWKLKRPEQAGSSELRTVLTEALEDLIREGKKIMVFDGDLAGASGFDKIKKAYPDHFIEGGIAEANMAGTAAGMSLRGYIPFIHSFSPFVSRRTADQVYMAGAYSKNTINIYASDPGICAASNGGTHTTFEDIAFYRGVPEVEIFDVADGAQLRWLVFELAGRKGVHYIRGTRKTVPDIYEKDSVFEIGKGNIIRKGTDVLLISMGFVLKDALNAAYNLESRGISVEVADMFTVKPLDEELIAREMKGKKLVVTYENHSVLNGLGSAVSEVMAGLGAGTRLRRVGVLDRFGQVGDVEFLKKEYGLTAEHLEAVVLEELQQDECTWMKKCI